MSAEGQTYSFNELIERANQSAAENNLTKSLELFERAALLAVPSTELLYLLGTIHKMTGNVDRATWLIGEVLRREPAHRGAIDYLYKQNPWTTSLLSDGAVTPAQMSQLNRARHIVIYPAATPEIMESDRVLYEADGKYCGIDMLPFGIPCEGGWWPFEKLDKAWKEGYRPLMEAYEKLATTATAGDVLIAAGGSMMHPEFVKQLPCYSVFVCGDDPESTNVLSRPAAPAFDFSLVLNVACLDMYRSWGCRNVDWIYCCPNKIFEDNSPSEEEMLNGDRTIPISLLCERIYGASDRAQRVETLISAFPETLVRGKGWPGGFVSNEEMISIYRNSKIGWNLHNSIGPTNSRTYSLPLMGMMQICDNKSHLGMIYELEKEVVGFDSISECVDKTRYYLDHEEERKEIAYRGWLKTKREYSLANFYSTIDSKIATDYFRKLSPAKV